MGFFQKLYRILIDAIETLLVAGSVFVVVYMFLVKPFQVNGLSMYPTFDDKEGILTNLITLRISPIRRGDIIVFNAIAANQPEKDFIKRVIGLPGETVMIKAGDVYLNGNKFDQSAFLKDDVKTFGGSFLHEATPVTVPTDSYFVMGDNRPYSSDSREWGFVTKSAIIGESWIVYWPPNKISVINNPLP